MVKFVITLIATIISLPNALYAEGWMKFGNNGKYILDLTSIYKSNQIVSYTWRNFLENNTKNTVTWGGKNYSEHVGYVNCKSSETKIAEWMPWSAIVKQNIPKYIFENYCQEGIGPITSKPIKKDNYQVTKIDSLGLPEIKGWGKVDKGDKVLYVNPQLFQLRVRGNYGRYLMQESILRWYINPTKSTPPSTIGSYQTDCYEIYGHINCTTKPPIIIQGKPGNPGGVGQNKTYTVVDCQDETYRRYGKFFGHNHRKRWKKILDDKTGQTERLLSQCKNISSFLKTSYPNI